MLSGLRSRAVDRAAARPLEQPVAFHIAHHRDVGGHRPGPGLFFGDHLEVVVMKLVAPTGMLPVLDGQQFDQFGVQRGMLTVVGADFAFEGFDRSGLGAQRFVIPPLQG